MDFAHYFLVGFLGSAHCVGMCGPIVLAYAVHDRSTTRQLIGHVSYNAGRILMWVFLGASLAAASGLLLALLPVEKGLTLVLGGFIALLSLLRLFRMPVFFRIGERAPALRSLARPFNALISQPGLTSRLALGVLNGLLPCGLSYSVLAISATSNSPITGALIMLAFGLGTVPALLVLGIFTTRLPAKMQRWGERLAVVIVFFMGLSLIARALGWHLHELIPPGVHERIHLLDDNQSGSGIS